MEWSRFNALTLRQLRTFCTVARLLSYTRAAEELDCQQPTVSALVAELERITRLKLLEQWGRHVALTDEGRELYAHAQKIVATLDEAWQVLAELREGIAVESGPLRIAADTTVGTYVLPALLADFRRWRPTSALQLRIANRLEVRASLLSGEVDLVIAGRPPAIVGLQIIPFLTNPLVVVAASTHELARQQQIPLARLAEETFLLREEGSGTRAAIEELFEVAGLPLKIGMVFGHIEAIKQAVAAGLGVSVLSEVAVRRELRSHKLAILQVENFPLLRRWYIAYATQQPLSAQAGEFIEFLNRYSSGKSSV